MKKSEVDTERNVVQYLGKDAAFFYRKITKIKRDIPLNFDLKQLKLIVRKNHWEMIFKEYEMNSIYIHESKQTF